MNKTSEQLGIDYSRAQTILDKYVKDPIVKMHCIESEAIMRDLAKNFGENEEVWGIVGLLHDIDWDLTKNDTGQHCVKAKEILKSEGATDFLIETIVSHGWGWKGATSSDLIGKQRTTKLQHALVSSETLTGLIVASALVQPDKKLSSVSQYSLMKKFKDKGFATRCDRELIRECEKAGIELEEFIELGLKSLKCISEKLGL